MSNKHSKDADEKLIKDHDYDGIQELDNDLPNWWMFLFYITVLFAIGYMINVQLEEKRNKGGASGGADEPSTDPAILAEGSKVFAGHCATCHGADGGGLVGPNLADNFWIHGASFKDIQHIIAKGQVDKGMLAFETLISPDDRYKVASYVVSLRGTKPANPKEPQGIEYDDQNNPIDGNASSSDGKAPSPDGKAPE